MDTDSLRVLYQQRRAFKSSPVQVTQHSLSTRTKALIQQCKGFYVGVTMEESFDYQLAHRCALTTSSLSALLAALQLSREALADELKKRPENQTCYCYSYCF